MNRYELDGYDMDDVVEVALAVADGGWVYGEKRFILCDGADSDSVLHTWSAWQPARDTKILDRPFRRERRECSACEEREYRAQPL